jgi:hypothetical protein
MKIRQVVAEMLHAERGTETRADKLMDGQTDMTKLTVSSGKFYKRPEIRTK